MSSETGAKAETSFFELKATHNRNRWILPVVPGITVGPPKMKFLFGGVGLASAVHALEQTTGRPLVWATSQYLSYANPPEIVDVDVIVPKIGKNITQARVLGHVQEREIFTVNAAVGSRGKEHDHQWVTMPDVPGPDACDPMPRFGREEEEEPDLHERMNLRVAKGRYGPDRNNKGLSKDGHAVLWARPKNESLPIDAAMLAVIADFIPSASGHALGKIAGANSLDNTIRIRKIVPTDWVCCDIQIHGIHDGFVHGDARLFAQDGTLMAIASQSAILRIWDNFEMRKEK
ncbi:acyl-CoA thioesterase [Ponticaulis profundi]|uniref:Acyl-CoA thioesterase n=1 Tax=Ponticaulis profundi TaxID=2665222 RepID=A0ABW1S9C7_9PROT